MDETLRLYCDVARHRSFSKAAAEHDITQSAASQRISQLERKLGAILIDRSVRPLVLTPAGEIFLVESRELLKRYDDLTRRVSQLNPQLSGQVTIDAIYSAGIELLNNLKARFEQAQPGVRVFVEFKHPDEIYDAVRHEQCDFGIVSYPQTWRDVSMIALREEPMAVVCAAGHELAGRTLDDLTDLDRWPMAAFEGELPVARHIRRYLREHGVKPNVTSVFDNIDTIKNAVAVTGQIAILPERSVKRDVRAGTLVTVALNPVPVRPIGLIHRKQRSGAPVFSPAVQAFVDFLLEHANDDIDVLERKAITSPPNSARKDSGNTSNNVPESVLAGGKS